MGLGLTLTTGRFENGLEKLCFQFSNKDNTKSTKDRLLQRTAAAEEVIRSVGDSRLSAKLFLFRCIIRGGGV